MPPRADAVNWARVQGKSTLIPGETSHRAGSKPVQENRLRGAGVSRGHSIEVFFGKDRTMRRMSTVSSSRDEPVKQKPSERRTTTPTKQVKPVGVERS